MNWLLLVTSAWAEEGAEHLAEHGDHQVVIPWMNISVQAFNFFLLMGLLVYFLRRTVKAHFATRASEYRQMVDRAERARREAEASRNAIQERMNQLEASAKTTVEQAKSEAEQLRSRMMEEAKALSSKLGQEAQRTAQVELEKAKAELRRELLVKGLSASREALQKNLGSHDQKKLQNEFVEKIGVVGG